MLTADFATESSDSVATVVPKPDFVLISDSRTSWPPRVEDVAVLVTVVAVVVAVAVAIAAVVVVVNSANWCSMFDRIATNCRGTESRVEDFAVCAVAWVDFQAPLMKRPFLPSLSSSLQHTAQNDKI